MIATVKFFLSSAWLAGLEGQPTWPGPARQFGPLGEVANMAARPTRLTVIFMNERNGT